MVKTDESMVEAKAWLKCLRNGLDLLLPPLPFFGETCLYSGNLTGSVT